MPDGRRPIALGPSNPPSTSPNKSVMKLGAYGPRHISSTGVTLHRFPKQVNFLQKFSCHNVVASSKGADLGSFGVRVAVEVWCRGDGQAPFSSTLTLGWGWVGREPWVG